LDRDEGAEEPLRTAEELLRDRLEPKRLCIAVIPCKLSSRRLPLKNVRDVAELPMVVHAAAKALACPHVDLVAVSTDDVILLQEKVPQFKSKLFEDRFYLIQRSGPACHPDAAVYSIVQDTLRLLAEHGVVRQSVTHLVMMQPNVPTIPQDVVDRLVKAVVLEDYNVARHFDTSGAQTGGCIAYKFAAFQSAMLMDAYNYAVITPDLEVHTEEDLIMAEQALKMRSSTRDKDHPYGDVEALQSTNVEGYRHGPGPS